jgi:hypothetical protein
MHRFLKQLEPFPTFSKHLVQKVPGRLTGLWGGPALLRSPPCESKNVG